MGGPLSRLVVVELADDLSAAYCAHQFASWGARVPLLEPPQGSPLRRRAPLGKLRSGREVSFVWEYVAAGKESHVFASATELSTKAHELLDQAQVFVTDWPETHLEAVGLSLNSLTQAHPGLIVVAIRPFGNFGPYSQFEGGDLIVQALASFPSFNGYPDRAPLKGPANVLGYASGVSAFVGALAALHERTTSGAGQIVEVSCQEAIASLVQTLRTEYSGQPLARLGGPAGGTLILPCKDGFVSINPVADGAWPRVLAALSLDEDSVPAMLKTPDGKRNRTLLTDFLSAKTSNFQASELFELLNTLGVICGRLNTPADLLADKHLAARDFFYKVEARDRQTICFPGPPARMSRTPMERPSPAPELMREHRPPAVRQFPVQPRVEARATEPRPPLAGIRIVDLAQAWLGSYAVMLLAHLGADVVKIESPTRPDIWRGDLARLQASSPRNPKAHPWNTNASFNSVNLDKRDVALDLAHSSGKELFLRMVAEADIVTENFSPRVLENLGLTYEELRRANPDLVMVSFSGYGRTGPYRDFKSNGAVTETTSGWSNYLGYLGEGPMMMGTMQADAITGLQMAACTLVALLHRDFTGEGQFVEGSMLESAVGYIGEEVLQASVSTAPVQCRGNRSLDQVPHGIFPARGEEQWLALSIGDDATWEKFAAFLGLDARQREKFATLSGRMKGIDEIEGFVTDWARNFDAREAMRGLQAQGIPAAVVLDTKTIFDDPHLMARRWFHSVEHPDMGTHRYNGFPWRFGRTPAVTRLPPPRLGEHTREVLAEIGTPESQVEAMRRSGSVAEVLELDQFPGTA